MVEKLKDVIFDANYKDIVEKGWKVYFEEKDIVNREEKKSTQKSTQKSSSWENKKKGFFDSFFEMIFGEQWSKSTQKSSKWKQKKSKKENKSKNFEEKSLEEQLRQIVRLPDEEYSEKLLTSKLRNYIDKEEKEYISALADQKTHIAPSFWEVKSNHINVSWLYWKTFYANVYPSYMDFLWTREVLSFHNKWDMSWFIYPSDSTKMQAVLKRRATQLKAELSEAQSKWITVDSETEVEYKDVESIRQKLATKEERFFQASYYITLYNESDEKLSEEWRNLEQKLSGVGIRAKQAIHRMDEGFDSCLPLCNDKLWIYRSMVTTSLAWSFPFVSNDLIDNTGILYWLNLHTWWLVVFDRYSNKLPNANSLVLATSWAGKSFTVKLEILRYLLLGVDVIVIDPENEYKSLVDRCWGEYINIASNSGQYINPFDMPPKIEDIEYWKGDLLRSQIMSLVGLISVLLWWISVEEEALLDKAIQSTYELKDITFEDESIEWKEIPIMEDLLTILEWMEWWDKLATKLSKYVTGTFSKLFNNYTNVDLKAGLTVFSIRDLDEALKTPAMYNVLNFIWTKVRAEKKKRLLVVDEAWTMMQHDMSANFLFGLIKRARKYWLGVTTITQDVEDFIQSWYWKPIVANSAVQLLLKQSTTSIKSLEVAFSLSEAEKQKLVASNVWEGLFFAGNQHIALKVLWSPHEREFIET